MLSFRRRTIAKRADLIGQPRKTLYYYSLEKHCESHVKSVGFSHYVFGVCPVEKAEIVAEVDADKVSDIETEANAYGKVKTPLGTILIEVVDALGNACHSRSGGGCKSYVELRSCVCENVEGIKDIDAVLHVDRNCDVVAYIVGLCDSFESSGLASDVTIINTRND